MEAAGYLVLFLAAVLISGCIGGEGEKFRCDDGSFVSNPLECKAAAKPKADPEKALKVCDGLRSDDRHACYTNVAVKDGDLSVCDRIDDREWVRFCYGKLNMTPTWVEDAPEETSSTNPRTTTTSTSTTIKPIVCGNGVLDEGEDCDMGRVCAGSEGVCGIASSGLLATCQYAGKCDWSSQTSLAGEYDIGMCLGCYSPGTDNQCLCIGQKTIGRNTTGKKTTSGAKITNSTAWAAGQKSNYDDGGEIVYHKECSGGRCLNVKGAGANECTDDTKCRHHECTGVRCYLVMTPGTDSCKADAECA